MRDAIYPFAALGQLPQHIRYKRQKPSELIIGQNNIISEHVTMHIGTAVDKMETVIGDNGVYGIGHIAHDCIVGDNFIMAQNAALGGHVIVEDNVYLVLIQPHIPFVRIGHDAVIGGVSAVVADVIPYGAVYGERGMLNGVNIVGLKRRGADKQTMRAIKILIMTYSYQMGF